MLAAKRNLGTLGPPKKLNIACTDDNQSKVLEHNIIVNNQHGRQPFEGFEKFNLPLQLASSPAISKS